MNNKSNVSIRVPLSMRDLDQAQLHGMHFLVWAIVIAVGSLDQVIKEGHIIFKEENFIEAHRKELPRSMGGYLSRIAGRKNLKQLKKVISMIFGSDFNERLLKDIEIHGIDRSEDEVES